MEVGIQSFISSNGKTHIPSVRKLAFSRQQETLPLQNVAHIWTSQVDETPTNMLHLRSRICQNPQITEYCSAVRIDSTNCTNHALASSSYATRHCNKPVDVLSRLCNGTRVQPGQRTAAECEAYGQLCAIASAIPSAWSQLARHWPGCAF